MEHEAWELQPMNREKPILLLDGAKDADVLY